MLTAFERQRGPVRVLVLVPGGGEEASHDYATLGAAVDAWNELRRDYAGMASRDGVQRQLVLAIAVETLAVAAVVG